MLLQYFAHRQVARLGGDDSLGFVLLFFDLLLASPVVLGKGHHTPLYRRKLLDDADSAAVDK